MQQLKKNYKRIVVKVGSSLFCPSSKGLDREVFEGINNQISCLKKDGKEIVLVSSGAIAFGMHALGFSQRPGELKHLQAAAAVGQNILMDNYSNVFRKSDTKCAQVLLTRDDFDSRRRYLNAKNTILTLLGLGVIPVVNENDTISTEEIKFGDNDMLSALVATLIDADLLIIFSDVDGLLDKSKNLVRVVSEINSDIKALACPTSKNTCIGGMITKIDAAGVAVASGIPCIIANGKSKNIILDIAGKDDLLGNWTLFIPKKANLAARKRWIAFGSKPKGRIFVDDGAKKALLNNKSLLSVGVTAFAGDFQASDIVGIVDSTGSEFARGKASISVKQVEKVKGMRSDKEVIHCDNIVLFNS